MGLRVVGVGRTVGLGVMGFGNSSLRYGALGSRVEGFG